jgi:hypothetical protein
LRKKGSIFAINSSGKIFLTPKMVHWPKFFWRRGGGGGGGGGVGGGGGGRRYKLVPKKIF